MKLSTEQKKILNLLVDKYEKSATFLGKNKVKQTFQIRPEEVFPRYKDDAEYDYFVFLNEELGTLEEVGFVRLVRERGRVEKAVLKPEALNAIYQVSGRPSRAEQLAGLKDFLQERETELTARKENDSAHAEITEALLEYIQNQNRRFSEGKLPEQFDGDREGYEDLWKCLLYITGAEDEIYVRDLSVLLFHDSKRLETLRSRLETLLFKYGEFSEKENVLSECGIIQNPGYVQLKGQIRIGFGEQVLDAGLLSGEIGFSDKTLEDILTVHVYGDRLITVENLTTFHRLDPQKKAAVVYLGGYHSRAKRMLLKKIYEQNPAVAYYHFGDIDAGGFYILEHLKKKTGIPFRTWKMDRKTLEQNKAFAQPLTENDRTRLAKLKSRCAEEENETPSEKEIPETIEAMLKEDRKLEQEAIQDLSF